ncbi:MAG TPA: hypothetical protein PKA12_09625 [Saprospiraceae bacterium]|nr:hypothetical protein [Saprospiraceae bacterium]
MKNKIAFLTGVLAYVGLAIILSAYGNKNMHTYINDAITDAFIKQMPSDPDLKNYFIQPNAKVKGTGVTAPGQYYITEGDMNQTFKEWLRHGGYSADEPEALQAIRHFYDPKGLDAGRLYLTDFPPLLGLANPEVDILSWALEYNGEVVNGTQGLHYLFQYNSWEDGKRSFAQAMQETDPVKQDKLMAHAWRCLGESLHALADMACPVHVRNDGHPPGDADPFENAIQGIGYLPASPQNLWDQALINKMKGRDSIRQIFHDMALYTNENFFTNQTIYGSGVEPIKPVIRPGNPYPLPYARETGGGWEYVADEYTYYKDFGTSMVKMCKDRYYFANALTTNYRTAAAYVDLDVAKSQSTILLSNLIGIGPEVVKRFLPEMKVNIDDVSTIDNHVYGSVSITRNPEYSWIFSYNSNVTIWNYTKNKTVTAKATNGQFETSALAFSEGDEIQAYITLGGFQVYSEKVKAGGSIAEQFIKKSNDIYIDLSLSKVTFSNGEIGSISVSALDENDEDWDQITYNLNGTILTIHKELLFEIPGQKKTRSHDFTFNFSNDFEKIISMRQDMVLTEDNSSATSVWTSGYDIENVPFEIFFGSPGVIAPLNFSRYKIDDNNGIKASLKNFTYKSDIVYKSDGYHSIQTITKVDFDDPPPWQPNYFWVWFSKTH